MLFIWNNSKYKQIGLQMVQFSENVEKKREVRLSFVVFNFKYDNAGEFWAMISYSYNTWCLKISKHVLPPFFQSCYSIFSCTSLLSLAINKWHNLSSAIILARILCYLYKNKQTLFDRISLHLKFHSAQVNKYLSQLQRNRGDNQYQEYFPLQ